MKEIKQKIEELKEKLQSIVKVFNLEKKKQKIIELEILSQEEGFWQDNKKASGIMQDLEELNEDVSNVENIKQEISELEEISDVVNDEDVKNIEEKIKKLESKTLLSREYDKNSAILSIYTGAGGIDAQDWSQMLLQMYLHWAEKNNFKTKIINKTKGQEAGIKNATIEISGNWVYGKLRSEDGVHRLVRLSPFNANNLRQTSFATVEILPIIKEIKEVEINTSDLRVDTFRSSGAGGQSVNTIDSAVRITHIPTDIVASCQNERSQLQNKEQAMKILKAKLHQKYLQEKEKQESEMRGEISSGEWGSQIRSYILHPYKMVKDHRTKYETTDVEGVLNGDLEGFMESYLKSIVK